MPHVTGHTGNWRRCHVGILCCHSSQKNPAFCSDDHDRYGESAGMIDPRQSGGTASSNPDLKRVLSRTKHQLLQSLLTIFSRHHIVVQI